MSIYRLSKPTLSWDQNGTPHSDEFEDVYFDKHAGLQETQFVFLEHNRLADRFTELLSSNLEDDCSKQAFTIAETGFGTGLNFLCAWQLWQQRMSVANNTTRTSNKRLHFISVEKYPLSKEELKKSLCMWPDLAPLASELIQAYPIICKGLHRIELNQGQVILTLWFGEASEGFEALNSDVDAWFLDGFAPSKNPDMWNDNLFQQINRLSHTGTSFSTFTAAGIVRRGLQSVGFEVKKTKGFGKKREMLIGHLIEQPLTLAQRSTSGLAWFNNRTEPTLTKTKVLVIGAGLSGCHTASALAKKGIDVTIWDAHDDVAGEASGNPQGILYPKLTAHDTPLNRFYLSSYLFANRVLNRLSQNEEKIWQQTGLEQRPTSETEQARFAKLLTAKMYPEHIVQPVETEGLNQDQSIWLPLSGWVKPALWCKQLIQHDNITFCGNSEVSSLTLQDDSLNNDEAIWEVTKKGEATTYHFSHVVFCTANHKELVDSFIELPTKAIRGQVSSIELESAITLDKVICQNGYVSPPLAANSHSHSHKATLHFGSSYGLKETNTQVSVADHETNLTKLAELLPEHEWSSYLEKCKGRVSFRCTVTDYAPIIGPIPYSEKLAKNYGKLSKNAKWQSSTITPNIPNLYINIGHGSRGLISTPLSGEYIASLITNETSVYERKVEQTIHPARFMVKKLKRGELS